MLQTGPIAPTSIGAWALTFVLAGLASGVVWLIRRHFRYSMPVYRRIFGRDDDPTDEGHLSTAVDRFDSLDKAHSDLRGDVRDLHTDLRKVERRQEHVLANQRAIADKLGVDLRSPRLYDPPEDYRSPGDAAEDAD